eukprot:jgi/Mesen1/9670/ME000674S09282
MAASAGKTLGYVARDSSGVLTPFRFDRREVGPDDVALKIQFCGICHSDLHQIKNHWGNSTYPMVPGHEIVGVVTRVGANVSKFKEGQRVGVGCMVRSCKACKACSKGQEQYCPGVVFTYNSQDVDGTPTHGGYSSNMVAHQDFVLSIPESLPPDAAAPLLCAGVTVYSPMMHFGLNQPGNTLGVVGLGGLGHMAVKMGKAMGLRVVVLSRSADKEPEARQLLDADAYIVSKDDAAMKAAVGTLDYILDTVSARHDIASFLDLLAVDGKYVILGLPSEPFSVAANQLVSKRTLLAGSMIGGIKETQDMLDFCGEKNITCLIEKIPIDYVNAAMERLSKGDVKYRFVIDIEGSLKE